VLTAIREILSDIVGCRALAIFEIDPARGVLSPVDCVNVQPDELSNICVGLGPIGKVAETGDFYLGGIADQNLLACIPLRITDRIVGAIAIFRLLEQKLELETGDHELLEWLSTQAGLALHRATLQAEWNAAIGVDG
ncbi:MAG TPA: GAF domain-containing protein, partial [Candidatus Binatus sp.]|nr:GAF domain-containing protein [Candidatus Binatus sp.]